MPPRVSVIGGGPAGLMAAERLAQGGAEVTVYERMSRVARKFLLAGRGGLNLTHSEPLERFLSRYGAAAARLAPTIGAFPPEALRRWSEALGQPTFVGSSRRIFPAAMKASPLLRAWLARLAAQGVRFALRHRWLGWNAAGALRFDTPGGEIAVPCAAAVLALGGASWPQHGSDGSWVAILRGRGIAVRDLAPANCGFAVPWSDHIRARFAGAPLKSIAIAFAGKTVRGEAVVTKAGIEGGAVYALSSALREAIAASGEARIAIDVRPDLSAAALARRLAARRPGRSVPSALKAMGLAPVAVALLHEGRAGFPSAPDELAALIKSVPLRLTAPFPIERAISSAGGIVLDEIDERFMLRRLPGVFAAGEMLDWEAPTGGYLLQACFSTGAAAGEGALAWLGG